jgi:hypothetical protein
MDEKDKNKPEKLPKPADSVRVPSPGETVVRYDQLPAKLPEGKTIHPRRPLPLVPDAAPEKDSEDSEPPRLPFE